jgi:exopolysaccharide biosynthesis polyprenyl glycosylphosphotransferase
MIDQELALPTPISRLRRRPFSVQLAEHKKILVTVDALLVLVALVLGLWFGAQRSGWVFSVNLIIVYSPWFVGLIALYLLLGVVNDAYKPKVAADALASIVALLKIIVQIFGLYLLVYALTPFPYSNYIPRHFIAFFALIAPFLLMGWRRLYSLAFTLPAFQRRAIIVGAGWAGQTMLKTLQDFAPAHFEVAGFVDDDPAKQQNSIYNVPVLGPTADLITLAQKKGATDIVLAINRNVSGEVLDSLLTCYEHGLRVSTMPELYERLTERVPVEHSGDNWFVVLPLENNGQQLSYGLFKRGLDMVIAILGLGLFVPLLPLVALLIKFDSPGPIFYRQKRLGQAGKVFELIKLRSMYTDAEADGPQWAEKYDTRVTRLGQFLRRTRLDEVPQLLNVLRGEMSLIGPRPERPEFVATLQQEIPFYRTRLTVKPGLTGWAQVNYDYGRSASDALEKLRYDLYYIKHQSIQLDLVILLKTVSTILLLKGT